MWHDSSGAALKYRLSRHGKSSQNQKLNTFCLASTQLHTVFLNHSIVLALPALTLSQHSISLSKNMEFYALGATSS